MQMSDEPRSPGDPSPVKNPLAGSPWSAPGTVAGFARAAPNDVLVRFAAAELARPGALRALDLGCGAGRNAIPLARQGWDVTGTDLSWPMLAAAAHRAGEERLEARLTLLMAPMDRIPARDQTFDLIVAHGIWNLARSAAELRRAIAEAARVARPGAGVFVFTFARDTLPPESRPVPGEPFVFTEFSGAPQCFLTGSQLIAELGTAGFVPDDAVPLTEYNRPRPGSLQRTSGPVIYEAVFRHVGGG
jgi:SAM-dependent methyltransferase